MRVDELGEFGLIERLKNHVGAASPDAVTELGDDVAVLRMAGEREYVLATTDIQVEGVHFLPHAISPEQLGRKAAAINLSDIAACGGVPRHALVSLILTPVTEVEYVEALYDGFRTECEPHGAAVVGGNLARDERLVVDVFLLGEVERAHLCLRSGAKPGDLVMVTGTLGDSAAGLTLIQDTSITVSPSDRSRLIARHLVPTARVQEGSAAAATRRVTAMIDLSDGLSSDMGHICTKSGVGVRLLADLLPIDPSVERVAEKTGRNPRSFALEGGEDYELCLTVPRDAAEEVAAAVTEATGTTVTVVGEIVPQKEGRLLVLPDGEEVPLEATGWEHFKRGVGGP